MGATEIVLLCAGFAVVGAGLALAVRDLRDHQRTLRADADERHADLLDQHRETRRTIEECGAHVERVARALEQRRG